MKELIGIAYEKYHRGSPFMHGTPKSVAHTVKVSNIFYDKYLKVRDYGRAMESYMDIKFKKKVEKEVKEYGNN